MINGPSMLISDALINVTAGPMLIAFGGEKNIFAGCDSGKRNTHSHNIFNTRLILNGGYRFHIFQF